MNDQPYSIQCTLLNRNSTFNYQGDEDKTNQREREKKSETMRGFIQSKFHIDPWTLSTVEDCNLVIDKNCCL